MIEDHKVVAFREGGWWIGWLEDVPGVNAQERTREALMESLQSALADLLEIDREQSRGKRSLPSVNPFDFKANLGGWPDDNTDGFEKTLRRWREDD